MHCRRLQTGTNTEQIRAHRIARQKILFYYSMSSYLLPIGPGLESLTCTVSMLKNWYYLIESCLDLNLKLGFWSGDSQSEYFYAQETLNNELWPSFRNKLIKSNFWQKNTWWTESWRLCSYIKCRVCKSLLLYLRVLPYNMEICIPMYTSYPLSYF